MILLRSEAAIPGACLEMIGPLPARGGRSVGGPDPHTPTGRLVSDP
jgi:hypothetical protein